MPIIARRKLLTTSRVDVANFAETFATEPGDDSGINSNNNVNNNETICFNVTQST